MTGQRKARRIERMQTRIMDAAVDIICEKGFSNTTTKEIARVADMAEGTLYNYFRNKDDILMGIARRYISQRRQYDISTEVDSIEAFLVNLYAPSNDYDPDKSAKDRLVLKALLPEFLSDRALGQIYYQNIVHPYLETLEMKLTELQERGLVKPHEVTAMSRMMYSAFIGFAVLEINGDPLITEATEPFRQSLGHVFIDILARGMAPSER